MANGEWYYARGNQQQGPVALQAIQDLLRSGQVQPTDLVWRQGMPNWAAAHQVPELSAAIQPAAPAQFVPPPPPAYAGQNPVYPAAPLPYAHAFPGAPVPNYLVQAILVTMFCCLPFGIVSIVYAAQVNSKLAAGDYAGAVDASQKAKSWSLWSFGIGVFAFLAYLALVMLGAAVNHR